MITIRDAMAPAFAQPYLSAVKEELLLEALKHNTRRFQSLLEQIPSKKNNYAYAPGKWTLKEVLQHVIDAERVFSYRALSFARKDTTPLPGFNENAWAGQARGSERKWKELEREFRAQRKSTECLFRSFDEDQLLSGGTADGLPANVLGLGFLCAGHTAHHMRIIKERYL